MLKAMLLVQWKACRHVVIALVTASLALPIASVRTGWRAEATNYAMMLNELELWGYLYPVLAIVSAIAMAWTAWRSDRRGNHVYALLLPVPRWRYVLLRYGASGLLLVPLVLAVWIGALAAVLPLDLPSGLRTFPHLLALKYFVTLGMCFAIAFAVAAASTRTLGLAVRALGVFLAVHIAVLLLEPKVNLLWRLTTALATWPGPLSPLGGRWMLIDV
jgi:hypothetical protein